MRPSPCAGRCTSPNPGVRPQLRLPPGSQYGRPRCSSRAPARPSALHPSHLVGGKMVSFVELATGRPLAHLGEERELAGVGGAVLVDELGRVIAGEAMIGELRGALIAPLVAERLIDAVDRQERQAGGADEFLHL